MARDKAAEPVKKDKWKPASQVTREGTERYVPDYEKVVEAPRRIVAASAAIQKRGKTTFGFTMPKPMAYLQLDANYEHALARALKQYGKNSIRHLRYFADPRADIKGANLSVWQRFLKDFDYCVQNFKSVMVDTTSELLDVRKIAEFGRTTQILQLYYGGFYADLRWMVKHALDNNANVLFVHRMKKEYVNDSWAGGYELEGWRGVMYEAQVYLEHQRDADGAFSTTIMECSQDAMLMGQVLSAADDENDFATLASRIYGTDKEEWQ